jgi:hypothetical protein
MSYSHARRLLESNIADADGRISVLLSSMDAWSAKTLGKAELDRREAQIANLRVNIREWQRLLGSIERQEMN